jgi:hypothetical protein
MQRACTMLAIFIIGRFASCTINFSLYIEHGKIFEGTLLKVKCVFCFCPQILSGIFLILRRIQRVTIINVHRSSFKVPFILVRF